MDLTLIRDRIPNFTMRSFIMFDEVVSLDWETVEDVLCEKSKRLTLVMTCDEGYRIELECENVHNFKFYGSGQISEFTIENMESQGYERAFRYKVSDFENGNIEFYCSDIIVKAVDIL